MITRIKVLPTGFYLDADEVFELSCKLEPIREVVDEDEQHGGIIHSIYRSCDEWLESHRAKPFWISYKQVRYLQVAADHFGHPFRMFGTVWEREFNHDGPFQTFNLRDQ